MTEPNQTKTEQDRLNEIRAWRARMVVSDEMAGRERNEEFEEGRIAVYQHTLDDYDFLLGMIDEYGLGK